MKEIYYRGTAYTNYTTTESALGPIYSFIHYGQRTYVLERDLDIKTLVSKILEQHYATSSSESGSSSPYKGVHYDLPSPYSASSSLPPSNATPAQL